MIPSNTGFLMGELETVVQPDRTYRIDAENILVRGTCNGLEAMKQAVFRMLNTERYKYVIYPWYYGIETEDLYGEPVTYVCPELERRITEALMVDERITDVTDFEHDTSVKRTVSTTFTVHTVLGEFRAEKEVVY